MSGWEVRRLTADRREDFFRVHCDAEGTGWCYCAAWWVETWDGWGERTGEQNRALREALFDRGELDGYLLYEGGRPIAWCQVGLRDRLEKLVAQFELQPDPEAWAITCFAVIPSERRRGAARFLLTEVLRDLRGRGAVRVQAFPKRGVDVPEMWTGPEELYRRAGFAVVREDESRPVLALELAPDGG